MSNFFLFAIDVLTTKGSIFIFIDLSLDSVRMDIVDFDVDGKIYVSVTVAVKKIFKTTNQKKS